MRIFFIWGGEMQSIYIDWLNSILIQSNVISNEFVFFLKKKIIVINDKKTYLQSYKSPTKKGVKIRLRVFGSFVSESDVPQAIHPWIRQTFDESLLCDGIFCNSNVYQKILNTRHITGKSNVVCLNYLRNCMNTFYVMFQ